MVIPVHDENYHDPDLRPWVMWALFALNVLVLVYLWLMPAEVVHAIAYNFGVVPAFVTGVIPPGDLELFMPPYLTLATYTLLHGTPGRA